MFKCGKQKRLLEKYRRLRDTAWTGMLQTKNFTEIRRLKRQWRSANKAYFEIQFLR